MNRVLVLGTGSAQGDLIKRCRERGCFVIATSNASGYPAQELANEFYQVDITDADATAKLAASKNVGLVYSVGSDVAMPTVAAVSEKLGLPCFFGHETAVICNHKHTLRKTLSEKKVEGNIPYQIIVRPDEKIRISFPAMMKPSDSQGQRGVRRVVCVDDVKQHFNETVRFSREGKVILEPYIEGNEISVNVFLHNGAIRFYLISDRKVWEDYPGGIIREHVIPSQYEGNEAVCAKIKKLVSDVLEAVGLKNGPAYFQIKVTPEGIPFLIEVTPRLDGCHMWQVIRYSTGVDLLDASLDMLTGLPYTQPEVYETAPYSLEFLCGKPCSVFAKSNFVVPEHDFLRWYYEDGATVKPMNGYFEKCGYIIKKGMNQ